MTDRRTRARVEAEDTIGQLLARAELLAWSAKTTRAELREAFWRVSASRSTWYAALNTVSGGGVLDIRDARQRELVDRGPRAKRKRRSNGKGKLRAA